MNVLSQELAAFTHLFFPSTCFQCQVPLPDSKAICCVICQSHWAYTDLHKFQENAFTERFWGRIPLVQGAAMFHFLKGGVTQRIVHALKYDGKKHIGIRLGSIYGGTLRQYWEKDIPECIIPVPLHPKKRNARGYNQAAVFGRGLSLSMGIPLLEQCLIRTKYLTSQTQMSRSERFKNVLESFAVRREKQLTDHHALLVDDVLTTGATLEACALQLLAVPGVRISMATIAMAQV